MGESVSHYRIRSEGQIEEIAASIVGRYHKGQDEGYLVSLQRAWRGLIAAQETSLGLPDEALPAENGTLGYGREEVFGRDLPNHVWGKIFSWNHAWAGRPNTSSRPVRVACSNRVEISSGQRLSGPPIALRHLGALAASQAGETITAVTMRIRDHEVRREAYLEAVMPRIPGPETVAAWIAVRGHIPMTPQLAYKLEIEERLGDMATMTAVLGAQEVAIPAANDQQLVMM
jgi:hypothetical protein